MKISSCLLGLASLGSLACSEPSNTQSLSSTQGSAGATGGVAGAGALAGAGAGASGGSSGGTGGSSGGTGGSSGGGPAASSTFYVSGRDLYDRCGEKVVLRGVNEMIVWSPGKDGVPEFEQIAATGANSVRIVWNNEGTAGELDIAIQNAVAQQLIPMVEHHGATGDLSKVPEVVDYWTNPDVVAVLQKHAAYLLLNIANEAGDTVAQQDFEMAYQTAITRIRDTGVTMPLVIDAPSWGQDIDMLQAAGPGLLAHDPLHNVLFSVHMWWDDATGARVVSELAEGVATGLPLIVGEFAQHAVYLCDDSPFAYDVLLAEAQGHGIGWLAWSWGSVDNGDCAAEGSFDMTVGGIFGDWEEAWGGEVAVTNANSIQNTSVRPQSMLTGACP